jgi:DNA-binding beta-propeller fold protein YncE
VIIRHHGHVTRKFAFALVVPALAGLFLGASSGSSFTADATHVRIHVTEWEFSSVTPDTAPTGTVEFTIINDGVFAHDFSINGNTTPVIPGGQSATLTVQLNTPGLYTYFSTVDDWDREMVGGFTVTGTPVTPTTTKPPPPTVREPATNDLPLRHLADVPLPGSATRFDYQSVDAKRRRLFIAHLGAGSVVAFDLARQRVSGSVAGTPDVRGVLAVPALKRLYAAATGARALMTVDETTLRRLRSAPAGRFPDGVAYDPRDRRVFVSDVAGEQLTVFSADGKRIGAVRLGGAPGNVQYDQRSGHVIVAVGSRNELAAVAPRARKVIRRVRLSGCDDPHGVELVTEARRAYVACEGSATLVVVDLTRAMRQRGVVAVGNGPDVLDYDPGLKRLYVASESGTVSVFALVGGVRKLGEGAIDPHAHSVAVDPKTHRVYFPLENVGGRPVLRIMRPA